MRGPRNSDRAPGFWFLNTIFHPKEPELLGKMVGPSAGMDRKNLLWRRKCRRRVGVPYQGGCRSQAKGPSPLVKNRTSVH